MRIKIIKFNSEEIIYDAISFELRVNKISNWVKVVTTEGTHIVHDVAVLKSIGEI